MLSALAIIKPKTDPPPKKKAPKKKKVPTAYDESSIEYSDFTPLPPEQNVPDPAPVHDGLAFGEVDPEPDEVDEWQEMMKAAEEDDANEWDDTESRTDVAQSSELEEDEFPANEETQSPWSQSHRKMPAVAKERARVFGGTPIDFDDEFVP